MPWKIPRLQAKARARQRRQLCSEWITQKWKGVGGQEGVWSWAKLMYLFTGYPSCDMLQDSLGYSSPFFLFSYFRKMKNMELLMLLWVIIIIIILFKN